MSNILSIGLRSQFFTADSPTTPLSGGFLRFYAAGTLTPLTVYSDRDLTTSLGAVITLDSAGRTPTAVYVPNATPYKIRVEASDATLIQELDDLLSMPELSSIIQIDEARQLIGYIPTVDPVAPAVGDGVADDTIALAAAINNSTTPVINLGGKTFRLTGTCTITRDNITIENGTIDLSDVEGTSSMAAILFAGTNSTVNSIDSFALEGQTGILMDSTSGFSAGDIVFAENTIDYVTGIDNGCVYEIGSITGAQALILARPIDTDMTGGSMTRIATRSGITLRNIRFIGAQPADVAHVRKAVQFVRCRDVLVENCDFYGVHTYGIEFDRCHQGEVIGCRFRDFTSADPNTNSTAVVAREGSYGITMDRCSASNVQHTMITATAGTVGVNTDITCRNHIHNNGKEAVFFNPETLRGTADNVKANKTSATSIVSYGDKTVVERCETKDSGAHGIYVQSRRIAASPKSTIYVAGNRIEGTLATTGIFIDTFAGAPVSTVMVANNTISSPTANTVGIMIKSTLALIYQAATPGNIVSLTGSASIALLVEMSSPLIHLTMSGSYDSEASAVRLIVNAGGAFASFSGAAISAGAAIQSTGPGGVSLDVNGIVSGDSYGIHIATTGSNALTFSGRVAADGTAIGMDGTSGRGAISGFVQAVGGIGIHNNSGSGSIQARGALIDAATPTIGTVTV